MLLLEGRYGTPEKDVGFQELEPVLKGLEFGVAKKVQEGYSAEYALSFQHRFGETLTQLESE